MVLQVEWHVVGMLAFMVQFSSQSKSCEQHAAVLGSPASGSVMAMNGIKSLSPLHEQGRIKSPEVLNISLETAVISMRSMDLGSSEAVECHALCGHADNGW